MNAQDLIEMRKVVTAMSIIEKGTFKTELDSIVAADAELEKKLGVYKTLEQVNTRRDEIAKELQTREDALAAGETVLAEKVLGVEAVAIKLSEREAAVTEREGAVTNTETLARQTVSQQKADFETVAANQMKRTAELDEKQQRLVDREAKLLRAEKDLADRVASLAKLARV